MDIHKHVHPYAQVSQVPVGNPDRSVTERQRTRSSYMIEGLKITDDICGRLDNFQTKVIKLTGYNYNSLQIFGISMHQ